MPNGAIPNRTVGWSLVMMPITSRTRVFTLSRRQSPRFIVPPSLVYAAYVAESGNGRPAGYG